MDLKLSETARQQFLDSFVTREERLKSILKEHNENPSFSKKETYELQGFFIKGITLKHATKRLRQLIVRYGFHPDVTQANFDSWHIGLNVVEKEE